MRTMFRCGFRSGQYKKLGMGFSILSKTGMRNAVMYAWPLGKCRIEESGLRIPMSFLFWSGALEVEWKNVRSVEAFFEFPFSCVLIRFAPQHPDRETDCVAVKFMRRSRRDQFLSVVQNKIANACRLSGPSFNGASGKVRDEALDGISVIV